MNPRDALSIIKKAAPAVATALGGPLAGTAAAVVAGKLGTDPTPTAIAAALQADPNAAVKLREIEADLAKAAMLDTRDARQAHGGHWMTWLLPLLLLACYAGWTLLLALVQLPTGNGLNPERVSQALETLLTASVFFWIGSSRGSGEKQAAINAMRR